MLRNRIEAVEERILAATQRCGRHRSQVTLVAVSKKFSTGLMREGYQCGLREFGENYVQEFARKAPDLRDLSEARFHMIGHLQTNKAGVAARLFHVIQTADSAKLLERLDRAQADESAAVESGLPRTNEPIEVLLEIKLSDEENKTGIEPEAIASLLEAAGALDHIQVAGLMTIPPWSEDQEKSRPYFRRLAELASRYSLPHLSMGMSNDFEAAIEEGATIIRVGTAIFGARPKPAGDGQ